MRILCLLLLPIAAYGQPRGLTIEEAERLALENNRALHIAGSRFDAAEARHDEASASRFPSLRLYGSYTRLSDIEPFAVQVPFSPTPVVLSPVILNSYALRLSLQQPLFTGFRLHKTVEAAERSATSFRHDYEREKADLVLSTRVAYWNLFKSLEVKRIVSETIAQMRAHVRDVGLRMQQGLATRNDLLRVQVQLSSTQLLEIDAANAVRLARMTLSNVIGLPLDSDLQPASAPPDSIPGRMVSEARSLNLLIDDALRSRPDIRSQEARVLAGESAVAAARAGWYPQLHLVANYSYARPNPRILPAADEFRGTWDIGINLSLDLWNSLATVHQTAQAEATLAQTRDGLAQMRDAVALEVTRNHLEVAKSVEKVQVAAGGLEQAQENYRITKAKFAAGVATNTDLLDAEVALLHAQTNSVTARADYEIARAHLARSLGDERGSQ